MKDKGTKSQTLRLEAKVAGFPRNTLGDGTMSKSVKEMRLDIEWVKLIKEAKTIGLTQKEIRHFLAVKKVYP